MGGKYENVEKQLCTVHKTKKAAYLPKLSCVGKNIKDLKSQLAGQSSLSHRSNSQPSSASKADFLAERTSSEYVLWEWAKVKRNHCYKILGTNLKLCRRSEIFSYQKIIFLQFWKRSCMCGHNLWSTFMNTDDVQRWNSGRKVATKILIYPNKSIFRL